jgi:ribosomal subunit interface protein
MQLSISGKHLDVGDSLRAHVSEAITNTVKRYFDHATEGRVTFSHARHLFRADIWVRPAHDLVVQSHGETTDAYGAFDAAHDRLAKRLARYKGRLATRRQRPQTADASDRAQHFVLAENQPDPAEDADHGRPAIVAEIEAEIRSLTAGEAAMHLDLEDLPVLMFRNRAHGGLNVVYRRDDGTIGWIDPVPTATVPPA